MKQCLSFVKGMGAGIVLGMMSAGAIKYAGQHSRRFRKKTGKATKAISEIMEDIQALLD